MIEIYRKTWISSFVIGIGLAIFCILYYFIGYTSFMENGDVLVSYKRHICVMFDRDGISIQKRT